MIWRRPEKPARLVGVQHRRAHHLRIRCAAGAEHAALTSTQAASTLRTIACTTLGKAPASTALARTTAAAEEITQCTSATFSRSRHTHHHACNGHRDQKRDHDESHTSEHPRQGQAQVDGCAKGVQPSSRLQRKHTPGEVVEEQLRRVGIRGTHDILAEWQYHGRREQDEAPKCARQGRVELGHLEEKSPPRIRALGAVGSCPMQRLQQTTIAIPTSHRTSGERQTQEFLAEPIGLASVL
mmetsp:Transcript_92713/g.265813  ORF Transcript_92713/g.265813 Transcript_92713/m.265813 type:complete len:240 (+) Transcript_92713:1114-1833(+)